MFELVKPGGRINYRGIAIKISNICALMAATLFEWHPQS
jgi:hypothetical protein